MSRALIIAAGLSAVLAAVYAGKAMAAPTLPLPCLTVLRAAIGAELAKVLPAEPAERIASGFDAGDETRQASHAAMNVEIAAGRLEPGQMVAALAAGYAAGSKSPACPPDLLHAERAEFEKSVPLMLGMMTMVRTMAAGKKP